MSRADHLRNRNNICSRYVLTLKRKTAIRDIPERILTHWRYHSNSPSPNHARGHTWYVKPTSSQTLRLNSHLT